jgi:hypothetical protein
VVVSLSSLACLPDGRRGCTSIHYLVIADPRIVSRRAAEASERRKATSSSPMTQRLMEEVAMPDLEQYRESAFPPRDALLRELQAAHTTRRYDSLALRTAVTDFVVSAHHSGLGLDWVFSAIQDAINTGVLPPPDDSRRRAISDPVRHMASEAYTSCASDHAISNAEGSGR